jgi:tRNA pseudouridine 55 synthase
MFSGLSLIRKAEGRTSFQALGPIKMALGSGKVGHAGTLDRFATGLLVALAGSYSRLAPYIQSGEKFYRGTVRFGSETSTLDPEGEVVAQAPIPSRERLEAVLPAFRGRILQRPPAYSAVHVDGRRAYEIARGGEEPELKERSVEIRSLEIIAFEEGLAIIEVRCSSGTYIRSLARDLALACCSRAHLVALERLSIGPYKLEDAVAPEDFSPERDLRPFSSGDCQGLGLEAIALSKSAEVGAFLNGARLALSAFRRIDGGEPVLDRESAVFEASGEFLGIVVLTEGGLSYRMVMPRAGGTRP